MGIGLPPGSAPAGAKDGKADNPKGTKGRVPRGKNGMRFGKTRQPSTTTSTGESAWHGREEVLRGRVARVCVCVCVLRWWWWVGGAQGKRPSWRPQAVP